MAVILVPCTGVEGGDYKERQEQLEALVRVDTMIERLKNASPEEAMPKLGDILRKTAMESIYQVEERWETHEKAKAAILSRTGHADFFQAEFRKIKSEYRDKDNETRYDRERAMLFEILRQLPSPEVVALLGSLLKDDEDEPSPPRPGQDYVDHPANSSMAARALGMLLDKPPTQTVPDIYQKADIHAWRLWYAQVKAGTKGFQFKGSDTVHYLATPAKEERRPAASPPGTPVREKRLPLEENRDTPKKGPQKFPLIATVTAAALLALAVAWLAISKRNANAGS